MTAPANEGAGRYGKYELVERIGMGGMAEVFLAKVAGPSGFEKQLVIKRVLGHLQEDSSFTQMFLDEARLAARLAHPNICQVFDLGEVEGRYYIAMEHIGGLTLSALMRELYQRQRPLPLEAALRIITQLLEALAYAHNLPDEKGRPLQLVHRDVTPSNVMVTPHGSIKLLDFGIARAATKQFQTQVGVARGKVGFMSPEQLMAKPLDGRSDVFAVGALMYLMLTGSLPYGEPSMAPEALRRMVKGEFPPPRQVKPDLDPRLEAIILKAMSPEVTARYRSASSMMGAVEEYATKAGLSAGPRVLADVVTSLTTNGARDAGSRQTADALPPVPANETRAASAADASAATRADLEPVEDRATQPDRPKVVTKKPARANESATMVDTGDLVKSGPQKKVAAKRNETDTLTAPDRRVPRRSPRNALLWLFVLGSFGAGGYFAYTEFSGAPLTAVVEPPEPGTPTPTKAAPAPKPKDPAPVKGGTKTPPAPVAAPKPPAEPSAPEPTPAPPKPAAPETVPPKVVVVEAPPKPEPPPAVIATPKPAPPEVTPVTPDKKPEPEPVKVVRKRPPAPPQEPRVAVAVAAPPPPPIVDGPKGSLQVRTTPPAKIKIDGRPVGVAPQTVTLVEGSHRVQLEYPGGTSHSVLVNIVAGRETPLTDAQ